MSRISDLYILVNREFPNGTKESSMRKILSMTANGQTYSSQIGSFTTITEHVVGDFDAADKTVVLARLGLLEFVPLALSREALEEIVDHMTFGWFEFDNGIKGAIVAHFGQPVQGRPRRMPAQEAPQSQPTTSEGKYRIAAVVAANTEEELVRLIASYKNWRIFNGLCVLWGIASVCYLLIAGPPDGPAKRMSDIDNFIAILVYIGVVIGVSGLMWGSVSSETIKEGRQKLNRLRVRFKPTPLAWYSLDQWAKVKAAAIDPEALEETYEQWVATSQKQFSIQAAQGLGMKKVHIEAEALLAWCRAEERVNDASARAAYVSTQVVAWSRGAPVNSTLGRTEGPPRR